MWNTKKNWTWAKSVQGSLVECFWVHMVKGTSVKYFYPHNLLYLLYNHKFSTHTLWLCFNTVRILPVFIFQAGIWNKCVKPLSNRVQWVQFILRDNSKQKVLSFFGYHPSSVHNLETLKGKFPQTIMRIEWVREQFKRPNSTIMS